MPVLCERRRLTKSQLQKLRPYILARRRREQNQDLKLLIEIKEEEDRYEREECERKERDTLERAEKLQVAEGSLEGNKEILFCLGEVYNCLL